MILIGKTSDVSFLQQDMQQGEPRIDRSRV
ncbi:hypothetical protein SHVI106290_11790 [Shewanella violacea]